MAYALWMHAMEGVVLNCLMDVAFRKQVTIEKLRFFLDQKTLKAGMRTLFHSYTQTVPRRIREILRANRFIKQLPRRHRRMYEDASWQIALAPEHVLVQFSNDANFQGNRSLLGVADSLASNVRLDLVDTAHPSGCCRALSEAGFPRDTVQNITDLIMDPPVWKEVLRLESDSGLSIPPEIATVTWDNSPGVSR